MLPIAPGLNTLQPLQDNHDFVMACKKTQTDVINNTVKKVEELLASGTKVKWKSVQRHLIKEALAACRTQILGYPDVSQSLRDLTVQVTENKVETELKNRIEKLIPAS